MSKVRVPLLSLLPALAAVTVMGAATAAPAGPYAARCEGNPADPAVLVHIVGFKARTGIVRVQSYGGDPARYFDKGTYLKRVELRVPPAGPLDVCVPVPAPGTYAISVRHDIDGAGRTGRGDGGGLSGNPHLSLFDLLFKRKPDPAVVAVPVQRGVRTVPIVLNYLSGTSFRPVAG
jgi:uncharacterized protein (DUF2141 family)